MTFLPWKLEHHQRVHPQKKLVSFVWTTHFCNKRTEKMKHLENESNLLPISALNASLWNEWMCIFSTTCLYQSSPPPRNANVVNEKKHNFFFYIYKCTCNQPKGNTGNSCYDLFNTRSCS